MKAILIVFLLFLLACKNGTTTKKHLPSNVDEYVRADTAAFADKHAVYVPVYSHIYSATGTSSLVLATTLSIRNTSFTDSFYVSDVVYDGSQGEILNAILIRPYLSRHELY